MVQSCNQHSVLKSSLVDLAAFRPLRKFSQADLFIPMKVAQPALPRWNSSTARCLNRPVALLRIIDAGAENPSRFFMMAAASLGVMVSIILFSCK